MSTATCGSVIDLDELIAEAERLPPLPTTVVQLAALVADPEVDLRQVAEVMSLDQTLAAQVLRHANSAAAGGREPVVDGLTAVRRLGTSTVLAMAMSIGLSGRLGGPVPQYQIEAGDLWRHAVTASVAAEVVRGRTRVRVPVEASTAALLHDIGKLMIARYLSPNLVQLLALAARAERCPSWRAETIVLDTHHGEVGGLVLQSWDLPSTIVEAVIHHHDPEDHDIPAAHVVRLSDHIANELAEASPAPPGETDDASALGAEESEVHPRVWAERQASLAALGLTAEVYGEMVEAARVRYRLVASRYEAA
jgi:HD-like signal output (HDOD) protein